jgi:hypothetical protein
MEMVLMNPNEGGINILHASVQTPEWNQFRIHVGGQGMKS